jgi:hypothetical protein
VTLQFGQIEVRSAAALDLPLAAVEQVQPEVEQRRRHRPAADPQVAFRQVPPARPHHDRRNRVADLVLAPVGRREVDLPVQGGAQVELAQDHVVPGGRRGVLEVRHPHLGAGVERVDGHLALRRPGDLHAAVRQVGRRRRHRPRQVIADGLRRGQEIELRGTGGPAPPAPVEQLDPPGAELAIQRDDEVDGVRGEDLGVPALGRARDGDVFGVGHQNCSASVEPVRAVVELCGLSAVLTASK